MAERCAPRRSPGRTPLVDVHAHFYHPRVGPRRLGARERGALARRRAHRHHVSRRVDARQLGPHVAHVFPVARRRHAWATTRCSRCRTRTRPRSLLRDRESRTTPRTRSTRSSAASSAARWASSWRRAAAPMTRCSIRSPRRRRRRGLPVLHHIWQHRTREWPGQEISDGADLGALAQRHPRASFILAHIGGGGDWAHTFAAVRDIPNIYLDLSGSGVDRGMLDRAFESVGASRLLWGVRHHDGNGAREAARARGDGAERGRARGRAMAQRRTHLPAQRAPGDSHERRRCAPDGRTRARAT